MSMMKMLVDTFYCTPEMSPLGAPVLPVEQKNRTFQHASPPGGDCPAWFALCLREPGKDLSLNASLTACCSGSTKSVRVLNRDKG